VRWGGAAREQLKQEGNEKWCHCHDRQRGGSSKVKDRTTV
jgi:hypothetical protein